MEVTPNHPLYIEGRGWVNAEDVAIGDSLRRKDGGFAAVLAIERVVLDAPEMVYNFTVKGVHTYFVLEVGVLVHNCHLKDRLHRELAILDEQIATFGFPYAPPHKIMRTEDIRGILSGKVQLRFTHKQRVELLHRRRLAILDEQIATFGGPMHAPLYKVLEANDIRAKLKLLE